MSGKPKKTGRPSIEPSKKKTRPSVSLPPELLSELKEAKEATGMAVSALITACCRQQLATIVDSMTARGPKTSPMIVGLNKPHQKGNEAAKS